MFPPEETKDPRKLISDLWESLNRTGDHFGDEAFFEGNEEGFEAGLRFKTSINHSVLTPMSSYIREFAKEAGWKITLIKVSGGYLVIYGQRLT